MEKIVSLCKRRGFIFPSSEIYGGVSALWDYGQLGSLMKNNLKNFWIRRFVFEKENIVLMDGTVLMHPKVWEASGHLKNFTDPLVECKKCHSRFRTDHLVNNYQSDIQERLYKFIKEYLEESLYDVENKANPVAELTSGFKRRLEESDFPGREVDIISQYFKYAAEEALSSVNCDVDINDEGYFEGGCDFRETFYNRFSKPNINDLAEQIILDRNIKCPKCENREWSKPRQFNLMFKTFLGPVEDGASQIYLRPETAQAMFVDFKQIMESSRQKPPFGIAQIGRCFRNEITTSDFTFRSREFDIAEIEFFVKPGDDDKWFDFWLSEWERFFVDLGLKKENMRRLEHEKEKLAHYSKRTVDIEYKFPFGWAELAGVANRTDFDLSQHAKFSGKDLNYFDEAEKKNYTPYVIEPTMGLDRLLLALISDAYEEIKGGRTETTESTKEAEVILNLSEKIAPIKVAVFSLLKNKEELTNKAKEIYESLRPYFSTQYDETGSIGRRYRRQDEIGTPFCVTVDFDSIKNNDVTVRDRKTMEQERIKIDDLVQFFRKKLDI